MVPGYMGNMGYIIGWFVVKRIRFYVAWKKFRICFGF